jgi:hypothetical protein
MEAEERLNQKQKIDEKLIHIIDNFSDYGLKFKTDSHQGRARQPEDIKSIRIYY